MAVVPVVPVGAVVAQKRRKRIVARFRDAGATSATSATTLAALTLRDDHALKSLVRQNVLCRVGEDRLYLDEALWESHQSQHLRLALIITVIALLVVALIFGMAYWMAHR